MSGNSKGFTLIEIMTVVLAMGILLALAVPNIIKYRETSRAKACRVNLRSILAAVEEARLERDKATLNAIKYDGKIDYLVTGADSGTKIKYLPSILTCPADESAYTIEYHEDTDTYTVTCGSGKPGHELLSNDNGN
jgi:prepilin-type N-terminal cleavage/methylation domain-containing protein